MSAVTGGNGRSVGPALLCRPGRAMAAANRGTSRVARAAAPRITWRPRLCTSRRRSATRVFFFWSRARRSRAEGRPRGAVSKVPQGARLGPTSSPGGAVPASFPRVLPRHFPRYAVAVAVPARHAEIGPALLPFPSVSCWFRGHALHGPTSRSHHLSSRGRNCPVRPVRLTPSGAASTRATPPPPSPRTPAAETAASRAAGSPTPSCRARSSPAVRAPT